MAGKYLWYTNWIRLSNVYVLASSWERYWSTIPLLDCSRGAATGLLHKTVPCSKMPTQGGNRLKSRPRPASQATPPGAGCACSEGRSVLTGPAHEGASRNSPVQWSAFLKLQKGPYRLSALGAGSAGSYIRDLKVGKEHSEGKLVGFAGCPGLNRDQQW